MCFRIAFGNPLNCECASALMFSIQSQENSEPLNQFDHSEYLTDPAHYIQLKRTVTYTTNGLPFHFNSILVLYPYVICL